jgi:monofunctional biosynthetic peptidoglycan transglycosylase
MLSVVIMSVSIPLSLEPWQIVNDGVMGGVSSSRMAETEEGLLFMGDLSLDNNGGFASVRRLVEDRLSGTGSVLLEVRGDGRTYQFRLRQSGRFDGVAWRAEFETSEGWRRVELTYDAFEPVFRGRSVPQAGPVVPSTIEQIGFLLADKQPGPFRLEIRKIEFLPGRENDQE